MRRLIERAGIDFVQWRALLRAYIWIDYAAVLGAYGQREARMAVLRLILFVGLLTAVGFGLALMVWLAADPFSAALAVTSSTMAWVGLIMTSQVASLATPDDLAIIGFRPVTSRTFFAVRISALLLHPLETAVLIGWLPAVAFLAREDGSVAMALAAAAAVAGSSLIVSLWVMALYGWLIRRIPAERLARVLSWIGAAAGLAVTAIVMLASSHDDPARLLTTMLPRDARTVWLPPGWFASYVIVADGSAGWPETAAASASIAALLLAGRTLRGRTAAEYLDSVQQLTSLTRHRSRTPLSWPFLSGEARAVAVLIISHLRHDVRFQLAIVSAFAMGLMFVVLGSSYQKLPVDPFLTQGSREALVLPLLALLWVPSQVYQALVTTPEADAAWIFEATPSNRATIVVRSRDVIALAVLTPAVLLLSLLHIYAYGHPVHAVLHATVFGILAWILLQLSVVAAPRLPFSVPATQAGGFSLLSTIIQLAAGVPLILVVQYLAFRSFVHYGLTLVLLLALTAALTALTRRRIARGTLPTQ